MRPGAGEGGSAIETGWFKLFALAVVVMGLSHTVTRERIFAPLRERCGGKDTWAGYLVSCPYCFSHWLAFVLVPLTRTYPLRIAYDFGVVTWIADWFLSSVFVAILAAFLRVAFYFVDETQGLVRRQQRKIDGETSAEGRRKG